MVRVVHTVRIQPKRIFLPLKASIDHMKERAYFTAKMAEGSRGRCPRGIGAYEGSWGLRRVRLAIMQIA